MKVGIYARVSTHDQQTLPIPIEKMKEFVRNRNWTLTAEFQEIGSGAKTRPPREDLLKLVRRRQIEKESNSLKTVRLLFILIIRK